MLALKEEERQLSDAITRHKAVLSPIRRIPPEILSHIFLQSIPLPNKPFVPEDWLWQIERVCKTWRTTILGYPHFWSFIAFHVSQYSVFNNLQAQCYVSRLKTQLSRTQQLPLSVSLFDNSRARTRSMASWLFEVLEESASHIQELHVKLGVNLARYLRTSNLKGSLDSLSYLCIDIYANGAMETPISTFEQCPKLRHLELHAVSRPMPCFILPWHQIHKYYAFVGKGVGREGMLTVEDLLAVLAAASQLRDGSFRMHASAVGVSPTTTLVQCNHLRSLSLH